MHCHTNRSDGSDTPEFVIRLAKQIGLSALAITDHDYYAANYHAEGLGKRLGMRVINGVECSTYDLSRGHKVHILCYNIKHPDAVQELLSRITKARADASLAMLEKVSKQFRVNYQWLLTGQGEIDNYEEPTDRVTDELIVWLNKHPEVIRELQERMNLHK